MVTLPRVPGTSHHAKGGPAHAFRPLADDLEALDPAGHAAALRWSGLAPRLLEDGNRDLPAETASGVDPFWLGELPCGARHYGADLQTEEQFFTLFERCAGKPTARFDHRGFDAAIDRVRAWLAAEAVDRADMAAAAALPAAAPAARRTPARQRPLSAVYDPVALLELSRRDVFLPRSLHSLRRSAGRGTMMIMRPHA